MRTTSPVRVILWIALALTVIWGAQVVVTSPAGAEPAEAVAAPAPDAQAVHDLRVRKCERLVATYYAGSGFLPYCDYLVTTHERLEAEHDAPGFGAAWYYSLVYGAANFGLRVGGVAPGNCSGPMDVKHYPLIRDPERNIDYHCREMLGFYKRGVRGRRLCEYVMLPARPHDWGGGRFRRTDEKFRECIARGYAVGKL